MRYSWTSVLALLGIAATGCTGAPAASRRPLVTIPASAATTKATGIKQWRLHDYKNGGTTGLTIVALDGSFKVATAARIFKIPVGTKKVAAIANLFPTVGRMRFDTTHVVEQTMTKQQGAVYDLFQADARNAKGLPYDCSTGSAVKDGFECGVAVAICTGTTPADPACWGGAGLCAIDTFNDFSSCFGDDQQQQDPGNNGTDPGSSDPNGGGDTTVADNGGSGDNGGDTSGGDTTGDNGGDTSGGDTTGDNGDGSYDPNGDFGAGTDVGDCSDCGAGFGDDGGGDSSDA